MSDEYNKIRLYPSHPKWEDATPLSEEELAVHNQEIAKEAPVQKVESKATDVPKWEDATPLSQEEMDMVSLEEAPKEEEGLGTSLLAKLAQGASMNTTPYIAGATGFLGKLFGVDNAGNAIKDIGYNSEDAFDFGKAADEYSENYQREYDLQNKIQEESPVLSTVANIAGGIATLPALPAKVLMPLGAAAKGAGFVSSAAKGIGNAAIGGAAMGAIAPTSDAGLNLGERVENAAMGTAFGAGLGAAGAALSGGAKVAGKVVDKFKKEAPTLYRAGELGYEGNFIHSKNYQNELVKRMNNAVEDVNVAVGEIGAKEKGVRDELAATLKIKIEGHKKDLADIDSKLEAKIADLYKSSKGKNSRELHKLVDNEIANAEKAKAVVTERIETLANENKQYFGNIVDETKDYKQMQIDAKTLEQADAAEIANVQEPDSIKNRIQNSIREVGKYLGNQYNVFEGKLDKIAEQQSKGRLEQMINEFRQFHGKNPSKDMIQSMKNSADAPFRFGMVDDAGNGPLQVLRSKIASIGEFNNDPSVVELVEKQIAPFLQEGDISLQDFRSLLNSTKENSSILTKVRDAVAQKPGSKEYLSAFREFNDSMRQVRNGYIQKIDPKLAKEFDALNKNYSDYAGYRDKYVKENTITQNLTPEQIANLDIANTTLLGKVKQYGKHGRVDKAAELYDDFGRSINPEIARNQALLDDYRSAYSAFEDLPKPNVGTDINALDSAIGAVEDVAGISRPSKKQVMGLLKYENGQQISEDDLGKIVKNFAEIRKLEMDPTNPQGLIAIQKYKKDIGDILKGEAPQNIQNIPEGVAFKIGKLTNEAKVIENKATDAMEGARIASENQKSALANKYGSSFESKLDALKELENPTSKNILDDMIKLRSQQNDFARKVNDLIAKGADPEALKMTGFEGDRLDQLIAQITERAKGVPNLPDMKKLSELAMDLNLVNTDIRGTLNTKSLGLIETAGPTVANMLGIVAGKGVKAIDAATGMVKAPINVGAQMGQKAIAPTVETFRKLKSFDTALKNAGTNINDFNAMDAVKKAATIQTLMQNSATRETAKEMEKEYGK